MGFCSYAEDVRCVRTDLRKIMPGVLVSKLLMVRLVLRLLRVTCSRLVLYCLNVILLLYLFVPCLDFKPTTFAVFGIESWCTSGFPSVDDVAFDFKGPLVRGCQLHLTKPFVDEISFNFLRMEGISSLKVRKPEVLSYKPCKLRQKTGRNLSKGPFLLVQVAQESTSAPLTSQCDQLQAFAEISNHHWI